MTAIKSNVLSVFDFDGTLTYHDSFILFLYFTFGKYYFVSHLIRTIPYVLRFLYGKASRNEIKRVLISKFFTNVNEQWLSQKAEVFCEKYWEKLMRPTAISAVKEEVRSGAEVTICSASPSIILQPFAKKLNIKAIGTDLEVKKEKLTGKILGHNCRCGQKIIRLNQVYGSLTNYYLRVWGDSQGDYELLAIAQEAYLKHFH